MSRWRVIAPISSAAIGLAQIRKPFDAVQIDHVVGQHVAHVQHRHQRLATGEQLGVSSRRSRPTASSTVCGS